MLGVCYSVISRDLSVLVWLAVQLSKAVRGTGLMLQDDTHKDQVSQLQLVTCMV